MTTAINLIRTLHSRGISTRVAGDHLRLVGHGSELSQAEMSALKQHKAGIISDLAADAKSQLPRFPKTCAECG